MEVARRSAVLAVFFVAVLVMCVGAVVALGSSPPKGATARCKDGTYSYAKHHQGACSHHHGVAEWLDGSSATSAKKVAVGRTVSFGERTKSSNCVLGADPDRRCSPGAYYTKLTKTVICSASFRTSQVRNVPQSVKYAVEGEYGLSARLYGSTLEIDHIVPLELGGSNDIANLFPEKANASPGYHVKDKLENKLHGLVCGGSMNLRGAQRGIAVDWQAQYEKVFGTKPRG